MKISARVLPEKKAPALLIIKVHKAFFIMLFFYCSAMCGQNKKVSDIHTISKSDSVFFTVNTSGCFNSGAVVYVIIKSKKNSRKIIFEKEGKRFSKEITSKKFKVFLDNYEKSMQRFSSDTPSTCTLVTDFELSNGKAKVTFTNGTCQNEFNPELTLENLLK